MSANKKLFKTAMFGFEKKSVFEYIARLERNAVEESDTLKDQMTELEKVNEELRTQLADAKNKANEAEKLAERVKALENELENVKIENESLNGEINDIVESAEEIKNECETKSRMTAEKIIRDAMMESEKIKSQSEELLDINLKKVKYLRRRREELKKTLLDVKSKTDSVISEISVMLDEEKK